ncbi:hypothetical protein BH09PSE5_BH09PSE5_35230 [soil metagenome]
MNKKITQVLAGVALVVSLGAATQAAHAGVSWSVGINVPPVGTVISNAPGYYSPPVYVQQPPVYYAPPPVYYAPRPIYYQPRPIYYQQPAPIYYRPAPPVYQPRFPDQRYWDRDRYHPR